MRPPRVQEKPDSRENRHKDAFHGTHSKVQFCLLDLTGYRINHESAASALPMQGTQTAALP